jgi:hypothetical protein
MKIAILSDIHSNLEALTACRERALEHGVEQFVCLGDCVGYGPDPAATMDLLLSRHGSIARPGRNTHGADPHTAGSPVRPGRR